MELELLLANISRHISLTQEETDFFVSLLQQKSLQSGEYLLREGEICRHESFIVKGCLKSYYTNEQGEDHILDFLIEEWWADDLYSFLTEKAATTYIKALEKTTVLQIGKQQLEELYKKVPKFERFFRLLFQNAYISQRNQINSLLSVPAEERYLYFLKQKPYAEKRFPQKDIASYLGITPQFLSVLRKKMRN